MPAFNLTPVPHPPLLGNFEPKPAKGFPPGLLRWRLRSDDFVRARVKTSKGIREFLVKNVDGFWMPDAEVARNHTAKPNP